mmetsp:Transcript_13009/g.52413  ORF Transcript_13009/g.52413 Transcript_13009/m.52413 type:complete len:258 (-) Transcript_13009:696-1469(-)
MSWRKSTRRIRPAESESSRSPTLSSSASAFASVLSMILAASPSLNPHPLTSNSSTASLLPHTASATARPTSPLIPPNSSLPLASILRSVRLLRASRASAEPAFGPNPHADTSSSRKEVTPESVTASINTAPASSPIFGFNRSDRDVSDVLTETALANEVAPKAPISLSPRSRRERTHRSSASTLARSVAPSHPILFALRSREVTDAFSARPSARGASFASSIWFCDKPRCVSVSACSNALAIFNAQPRRMPSVFAPS